MLKFMTASSVRPLTESSKVIKGETSVSLSCTGEDAFVHFDRNVAVESGEVAEAALLTAGEIDYLIQLLQDFADRTGRQRNSHSCL